MIGGAVAVRPGGPIPYPPGDVPLEKCLCPQAVVTNPGRNVMKTHPWHSKLPSDRPVHHDETRCTEGNNIEPRNRVSGTGGRPKCQRCSEISG